MKEWIGKDFLLTTATAQKLYHDHAAEMPIIDFHNHLNPALIAENKTFQSITEVWLGGDHYKWRLMRGFGIDEKYITGDASDRDKFKKWAELLPYTIGNPIFHWSHLELSRYFNINELVNSTNADSIFDQCNEMLASPEFSPCGLLNKMKVESLCTTDDPIDSLAAHQAIAKQKDKPDVRPTWRADKLLLVADLEVWRTYVQQLSNKSEIKITNLTSLIEALEKLQLFFEVNGCKVADIGISQFSEASINLEQVELIIPKILQEEEISEEEKATYQAGILYVLCMLNQKKNWVQQLHIGPLRNNNTRLFNSLGSDVGVDSMADSSVAIPLSTLLGKLDNEQKLAKTILYNLNPKDSDVLATMAYNFNDASCKGKMQYGAAWWFLDNYDGMTKQLDHISNYGLLSQFVGMLTDSRSFLSFTRHEYFRRILCEYLGQKIENGLIPTSMTLFTGKIVENICYNNAKQYFQF